LCHFCRPPRVGVGGLSRFRIDRLQQRFAGIAHLRCRSDEAGTVLGRLKVSVPSELSGGDGYKVADIVPYRCLVLCREKIAIGVNLSPPPRSGGKCRLANNLPPPHLVHVVVYAVVVCVGVVGDGLCVVLRALSRLGDGTCPLLVLNVKFGHRGVIP